MNDNQNIQWIKEENADTDQWRKKVSRNEYGYITQYSDTLDYNWQTARGEHRLSGISSDRDAAMHASDKMLTMPIDEFNSQVVTELLLKLKGIEQEILSLQPSTKLLPGFKAGYEEGVADTKRKIDEALRQAPNTEEWSLS